MCSQRSCQRGLLGHLHCRGFYPIYTARYHIRADSPTTSVFISGETHDPSQEPEALAGFLAGVGLSIAACGTAHAQCTRSCGVPPPPPSTLVSLYSFLGPPDGANPQGSLVQDASGNLYGTTSAGGVAAGYGTIFKLDTTGQETVLYSFTGTPDGASPLAGLVQDAAGNFYGTTSAGGTTGDGTVFKLDSTGKETILYSFTGTPDGASPQGNLIEDTAGNFYGTTSGGGATGNGTIFKLDTTGKETILYSFTNTPDGADPVAGLVQDASGNFYGTTAIGGASSGGTVFKLDSSGKETVLFSFAGGPGDGTNPRASLALDASGNLYGTTSDGGAGGCKRFERSMITSAVGCGTVFKVDGAGNATLLYTLEGPPDGAFSVSSLLLAAGGNLYGTTSEGGAGDCRVGAVQPPVSLAGSDGSCNTI